MIFSELEIMHVTWKLPDEVKVNSMFRVYWISAQICARAFLLFRSTFKSTLPKLRPTEYAPCIRAKAFAQETAFAREDRDVKTHFFLLFLFYEMMNQSWFQRDEGKRYRESRATCSGEVKRRERNRSLLAKDIDPGGGFKYSDISLIDYPPSCSVDHISDTRIKSNYRDKKS